MTRLNMLLDPTRRGPEADKLDAALRDRIIGQDEAIRQIVEVYQTYLAGLVSPGRPVGNFLFLGPTGTGKTRLVEATAESLVGDPHAIVKIDCAEFQHSHEIAKLIGSPPGYLGHRETRPFLSQEALNQHHTDKIKLSFVLFDEIEKASDALWNLLLGILDKATLTLGDNRQVDFSHTIIFMTSNLGAREMSSLAGPRLGFTFGSGTDTDFGEKVERAGIEAVRRRFSPEFINRLDKVVVFHHLGDAELRQILELELHSLSSRWRAAAEPSAALSIELSESAKAFLLEEGTDQRYGARHLKRAIERSLVYPMSNLVATEQVRGGDSVRVDFDPQLRRLLFFKEAEGGDFAAAAQAPAPPAVEPAEAAVAVSARTTRVRAK